MTLTVIVAFGLGVGIGCMFGDWLDSRDELSPKFRQRK